MDSRYSRLVLYSTQLGVVPGGGAVDAIIVRSGVSQVDHLMDNADKPNRSMMEASTDASSSTAFVSARAVLETGDLGTLSLGLDGTHMGRDALRTRVVMSGTFEDALWPQVRQDDLGAFAEASLHPGDRPTPSAATRRPTRASPASRPPPRSTWAPTGTCRSRRATPAAGT